MSLLVQSPILTPPFLSTTFLRCFLQLRQMSLLLYFGGITFQGKTIFLICASGTLSCGASIMFHSRNFETACSFEKRNKYSSKQHLMYSCTKSTCSLHFLHHLLVYVPYCQNDGFLLNGQSGKSLSIVSSFLALSKQYLQNLMLLIPTTYRRVATSACMQPRIVFDNYLSGISQTDFCMSSSSSQIQIG